MSAESPSGAEAGARSAWAFRFAGREVVAATDSEAVAALFPRLYGGHCRPAPPEGVPELFFLRDGTPPGDRWRVEEAGRGHASGAADFPTALSRFRERLQYRLVAEMDGPMVVHGAGVARDGRAFLFPGISGSGKTTLAAWLLGKGCRLLSDELVAVDAEHRAEGFRQPLNVKRTGAGVVGGFPWLEAALADAPEVSGGGLLIPCPGEPAAAVPVARIVFPRYTPHWTLEVEPLSPGHAAAALLGCLLNARNLPGNGIHAAAALCGAVPAARVRYSRLDEVTRWLEAPFGDSG